MGVSEFARGCAVGGRSLRVQADNATRRSRQVREADEIRKERIDKLLHCLLTEFVFIGRG